MNRAGGVPRYGRVPPVKNNRRSASSLAALSLGALGVVSSSSCCSPRATGWLVPTVPAHTRCEVKDLGHDCRQVTLNFGFKDEPDVPKALRQLRQNGCNVEDTETSYFRSRDIVIPTMGGGMADWREKLFASMHRNAAAAGDFLSLPTTRVVELGSKVEI
jgi:K+ transporter